MRRSVLFDTTSERRGQVIFKAVLNNNWLAIGELTFLKVPWNWITFPLDKELANAIVNLVSNDAVNFKFDSAGRQQCRRRHCELISPLV